MDTVQARIGTWFEMAEITQSVLRSPNLATLEYNNFKMMNADTQFLPTPASLAGNAPVVGFSTSATMATTNRIWWTTTRVAEWQAATATVSRTLEFQLPLTDSPDRSSMATFWSNQ